MSSEDETYIPTNSDYESYEEFEDASDEQHNPQGHFEEFEDYSSAAESSGEYEDYNHLYTTDRNFENRSSAFDWIQQVGMDYNMYFAIWTTRTNRTYVRCHRGREYRSTPRKEGATPRKSSGSVMTNCPFQLILEQTKWNGMWVIRTMPNKGRHNHALGKNKEGFRFPSALREEEFEIVRKHTALGVKPVKILGAINVSPRVNFTSLQHIYNARQKIKKEQMGELPPFKFFFKLLADEGWYQTSRTIPNTRQIGDIFFSDRRSMALCKQFPQVFLIDSTYKTNRWNLPLVEIIGVVPTGQNFHVAFAFIHDEKEDSYTWVMEQLSDILMDERPRIFVTDRELALMKAIKIVFSDATNLLCRRHIIVDVQKYLKRKVNAKNKEKILSSCWKAIVDAQTVESYNLAVNDLCASFREMPIFVNYVFQTWLNKHREQFVSFWVDQHMHYGSVTTNRVESAHAQLKNELQSARGDFHTVWEEINRVVKRQQATIAAQFEISRSKILHEARKGVFSRLSCKVSHKAILLMYKEIEYAWQRNKELCNHSLWRSHGLPCMCQILNFNEAKKCIPPDHIDQFWKSLFIDGSSIRSVGEQRAYEEARFDEAAESFKQRATGSELRKQAARWRNDEEDDDQSGDYEEPPAPPQKGRPPKATGNRFMSFFEKKKKQPKEQQSKQPKEVQSKQSRQSRQSRRPEKTIPLHILASMPHEIIDHLTRYFDVRGDGHCGYRALSWWNFSGDEERYNEIRYDMAAEMEMYMVFWWQYFSDFQDIFRKIDFYGECNSQYYWMSAFDMLPLAATRFQKIICLYAHLGSCTYLPLRCDYDDGNGVPPLPEIWHIGFKDAHFFVLDAAPDAPKPPCHAMWTRNCPDNIIVWPTLLGCSEEYWAPPQS